MTPDVILGATATVIVLIDRAPGILDKLNARAKEKQKHRVDLALIKAKGGESE